MSEMTLEEALSMVDGGPHHIGEWAQAATILSAEVRRLQAENARLRPEAEKPSQPMKPPTTGEKLEYGNLIDDPKDLAWVRTSHMVADRQARAAAIDAAIAAERERIAAFCEANPTKYGDQLAAAIRARGNA
jgi:hypothetical protein